MLHDAAEFARVHAARREAEEVHSCWNKTKSKTVLERHMAAAGEMMAVALAAGSHPKTAQAIQVGSRLSRCCPWTSVMVLPRKSSTGQCPRPCHLQRTAQRYSWKAHAWSEPRQCKSTLNDPQNCTPAASKWTASRVVEVFWHKYARCAQRPVHVPIP